MASTGRHQETHPVHLGAAGQASGRAALLCKARREQFPFRFSWVIPEIEDSFEPRW
jgi:hypothetical protein